MMTPRQIFTRAPWIRGAVRAAVLAPLPILATSAAGVMGAEAPAVAAPATRPADEGGERLRPAGEPAPAPRFDPTDAYQVRKVEGWTVRVSPALSRDAALTDATLQMLRFQLYQITREAPAPAVEKLRTVGIWVEENDPLVQCMCYHPDAGWVAGHGLNPDKTHCVELGNAKTFLDWVHQQPWMVFHELAHAYHDQFLPDGFRNADIIEAYRAAKTAKLYEHVLRNNGQTERAYAMTDPMEYFAEQSEAYFGTNDFYPFVRAELKAHDPVGHDTLRRAWDAGGHSKPHAETATPPALIKPNDEK